MKRSIPSPGFIPNSPDAVPDEIERYGDAGVDDDDPFALNDDDAPEDSPASQDQATPQPVSATPPVPVGTILRIEHDDGTVVAALRVFDPQAACRRFENLNGSAPPRGKHVGCLEGVDRLLAQMANDVAGGFRPLVIATRPMADAIANLAVEMPNFSTYLHQMETSARASARAQVPLHLPPTILVGPPGTGKTRLLRRLGEILGVPTKRISMPGMSGGAPLSGTDSTWKSSRPGSVAEVLVTSKCASPLFLLDEIDKAYTHQQSDQPLDILHDLWEREGATHFVDDCLKLNFCATGLYWLATANDLSALRPSLLDRAEVIEIVPPTPEQMQAVIATAYAECAEQWAGWFCPELNQPVVDRLRDMHPRRVHRILRAGMTHAVAAGRRELTVADIAAVASARGDHQRRMGFI